MHNFCINEIKLNNCSESGVLFRKIGETLYTSSNVSTSKLVGNSLLREIIIENLKLNGYCRPQYNLNRNTYTNK
jgi:hypothetical protein